jgi:hypothetical protein
VRIAGLEARHGRPPKTPTNSSVPPSKGQKADRPDAPAQKQGRKGRPSVARALCPDPDVTREIYAKSCSCDRSGEADLWGWDWSVPVRQAARGWQVPLAECAGQCDAAVGCGARSFAGRARLAAGSRGERDAGTDPPGVAYVYAPDRKAVRPIAHLAGFVGVLQVDGYGGYRALAERSAVTLAFCWAHVRRRFFELAAAGAIGRRSEAPADNTITAYARDLARELDRLLALKATQTVGRHLQASMFVDARDKLRRSLRLVARFNQIEGYRCLSLMRAVGVVNCQFALAWLALRSCSQAAISSMRVLIVGDAAIEAPGR